MKTRKLVFTYLLCSFIFHKNKHYFFLHAIFFCSLLFQQIYFFFFHLYATKQRFQPHKLRILTIISISLLRNIQTQQHHIM